MYIHQKQLILQENGQPKFGLYPLLVALMVLELQIGKITPHQLMLKLEE